MPGGIEEGSRPGGMEEGSRNDAGEGLAVPGEFKISAGMEKVSGTAASRDRFLLISMSNVSLREALPVANFSLPPPNFIAFPGFENGAEQLHVVNKTKVWRFWFLGWSISLFVSFCPLFKGSHSIAVPIALYCTGVLQGSCI